MIFETKKNVTETFLGPLTTIPTPCETVPVIKMFVPFFLLCLFLEIAFFPASHRLEDSITSLTSGLLQRLWGRALHRFVPLVPYAYLYEHVRLFDLPWESLEMGILCFLLVDLLYYVGHRLSHSNALFWSGHVVHHSSEFYNFSTAIRQGFLELTLMWPRVMFLAILGVPQIVFMMWNEVDVALMFFVHTESIGKLGWPIEWIFNTPSHHRVHHARNPRYIDKNYGGVFIVWDRLFGTFEEEVEPPVYGLVHPLHDYDPVEIQIDHLRHVCRDLWSSPSWRVLVGTLFCGPGVYWNSRTNQWDEYEIPAVDHVVEPDFQGRVDPEHPLLRPYLLLQFAVFMSIMVYVNFVWSFGNDVVLYSLVFCLALHSAIILGQIGQTSTRDAHTSAPLLMGSIWRYGQDVGLFVRKAEACRFGVWILASFVLPCPPSAQIACAITCLTSMTLVTLATARSRN